MIDVTAISCQELVELVTDYLEGALSEEETRRFEKHIGPCRNCKVYLEQMRTTISLVGRLNGTGLDADAETELLRAFRDWNRG